MCTDQAVTAQLRAQQNCKLDKVHGMCTSHAVSTYLGAQGCCKCVKNARDVSRPCGYRLVGNPRMFKICCKWVYEPRDNEPHEPIRAQRIHTSLEYTKVLIFSHVFAHIISHQMGDNMLPTRWETACVSETQHYTKQS